jgi:hypothetical protein
MAMLNERDGMLRQNINSVGEIQIKHVQSNVEYTRYVYKQTTKALLRATSLKRLIEMAACRIRRNTRTGI